MIYIRYIIFIIIVLYLRSQHSPLLAASPGLASQVPCPSYLGSLCAASEATS